jgi:5-methylcytosine-specific restriction endonuclease McrA
MIIPDKLVTKECTQLTLNINYLKYLNDQQKLNLNPDYQRDAKLWNKFEQTKLIQSILGGIGLPPIIWSKEESDDEDNSILTVIDGKQRLTTILTFINNGVLFYNDGDEQSGIYYEDLDDKYKQKFLNKNIQIQQYIGLDDTQQREIFERINYGLCLTNGEKIKGSTSSFLNHINSNLNNVGEYLKMLEIVNNRNSHYESICVIMAIITKKNQYVSRGKTCTKFIETMEKLDYDDSINDKIKDILNKLTIIHTKYKTYCKSRNYKKNKWRWTDILVYIYMFNDPTISKVDKKIEKIVRYICHLENHSKYLYSDSEIAQSFKNLFRKRENTNTSAFLEDRKKNLLEIFNYLEKKNNKIKREKIFKDKYEDVRGTCHFCNQNVIQVTNFECGHIISKYNGGPYEENNLYPICSSCNKSIGTNDLDIYCKQNNICINYFQ